MKFQTSNLKFYQKVLYCFRKVCCIQYNLFCYFLNVTVRSTVIALHRAHDMSPKWAHLSLLTNQEPSPLPRWAWSELPTLRTAFIILRSRDNVLGKFTFEQLLGPGAGSKRVMSAMNSGSHLFRNIIQKDPSTWETLSYHDDHTKGSL